MSKKLPKKNTNKVTKIKPNSNKGVLSNQFTEEELLLDITASNAHAELVPKLLNSEMSNYIPDREGNIALGLFCCFHHQNHQKSSKSHFVTEYSQPYIVGLDKGIPQG